MEWRDLWRFAMYAAGAELSSYLIDVLFKWSTKLTFTEMLVIISACVILDAVREGRPK